MPVKWEKIETNTVQFEIEVPASEVDTALDRAYRKVVRKVRLPGFRAGKVPRHVLESYFGPQILHEDALQLVVPVAYRRAVEKADLNPISDPDFKLQQMERGKPLHFTVTVDVMPEVKLGRYRGVAVTREEIAITPGQVDNYLQQLREQHARLVSVPPESEGTGALSRQGDLVIIDFTGYIDGEPFKGGDAENYSLELGTSTFIAGFEEQLEGAACGEEREVRVTFPENYHKEELAAKEALFEVKIKEIKRKELPVLNDDFAREISDAATLPEYRIQVQEQLEKSARERAQQQVKEDIIAKVAADSEVELPPVLVERQIDRMLEEMEQILRYQGLTLEKYVSLSKKTMDELREEKREEATRRAKAGAVLEAIIKQEGITVDETELKHRIEEIAQTYNDDPAHVQEVFAKQGRLQMIREELRLGKVIDFLVQEAKMIVVPSQQEEETKPS